MNQRTANEPFDTGNDALNDALDRLQAVWDGTQFAVNPHVTRREIFDSSIEVLKTSDRWTGKDKTDA